VRDFQDAFEASKSAAVLPLTRCVPGADRDAGQPERRLHRPRV